MTEPEDLTPLHLDTLILAIYFKGAKHTLEDSPELEARHQAHLRFLKNLRETGKTIASGPLSDTPDDTWRGVCLFKTSLEEAKACMDEDPQIKAQHFTYQIMSWHMPTGSIPIDKG